MRLSAILTGALILAASTAICQAAPAYGKCDGTVTGLGKAPHGANFDPPRKYNTEALAKTRAIADWSAKVKAGCPRSSTSWYRATNKKVSCDGYAGGIGCEATAHPRRRYF